MCPLVPAPPVLFLFILLTSTEAQSHIPQPILYHYWYSIIMPQWGVPAHDSLHRYIDPTDHVDMIFLIRT